MERESLRYHVSLRFEGMSLPPFQDILVLGKKCPHGPEGVVRCFNLLGPDEFEVIDLADDPKVDAIMVNKKILMRLPRETVIDILRKRVFPYIAPGELVRVDFKVALFYEQIEGEMKEPPAAETE